MPPNLKEKWWFCLDDCQEDRTDLILLEKWLGRMTFVREEFSTFKEEISEKTNGSPRHQSLVRAPT